MLDLTRMRKLSWVTVGFTYFLMVWGNLVSSTGSGLACPDWPLCHGTITPPMHPDIILEWGHRVLAAITGSLIIATVVASWKKSKENPLLRKVLRNLIILLPIQIVLGGITVKLGLSVIASTIHLLIATTLFSFLILIASVQTFGEDLKPATPAPKLSRLGKSALVGLVIQLLLGGIVRHGHAGLACPNFPGCLEGFLPIPFSMQGLFAFSHRWWGILLIGLFAHLMIAAKKQAPALKGLATLIAGVSIAQILLGILTVTTALHTHVRATHAAIGYALWGLTFFLTLRAGGLQRLWSRA